MAKKRKAAKRTKRVVLSDTLPRAPDLLHVVKLHTKEGKKVIAVVPGGYVAALTAPIVKVEPVGPWTHAWRSFVKFMR